MAAGLAVPFTLFRREEIFIAWHWRSLAKFASFLPPILYK